MGPRSSVEHDARRAVPVRLLNPFHERAFIIRLKKRNLHPKLPGECGKFAVDVFKGFRPVMFGISLAEQIEVDAVHDQNAIHRMMSFGLCGLRAGLRCCRGAQHREKEAGKPERNGLPVEKRT